MYTNYPIDYQRMSNYSMNYQSMNNQPMEYRNFNNEFQADDERFFWAPCVVGGLAGTALGFGIANNNQLNNGTMQPVYPVYPYPTYPSYPTYPTYPTYSNSNNYYY